MDRERAARYGRAASRWARLLVGGRAGARSPRLLRLGPHPRCRASRSPAGRPSSRSSRRAGPNRPTDFSLLYLGTTYLPRDLRPLLWLAKRRGAKIVVNQDGVAYPGWAGERTDELNEPLRRVVHAADHVVYQSAFSKRSSDEFLGEPRGTWEILPNAVDVDAFTPGPPPGRRPGRAPRRRPDAGVPPRARARDVPSRARRASGRAAARRAGGSSPIRSRHCAGSGSDRRSTSLAGTRRRRRPTLYRRAHVLLHTKVNDPCPTTVIEAMACGVPVAYAASGGTVELVGDEAGVGVPHPDGYERDEPPAAGGARCRGLIACSRTVSGSRPGPRDAPSSASRSPTGSTGTRSSSRRSWRRPPSLRGAPQTGAKPCEATRRASRRGTARGSCRAERARASAPTAGPHEHPRDDARPGSGSVRARSRRSPPSRRPSATSSSALTALTGCVTTSDGSYSTLRAGAQRADEVVDLLARRPGRPDCRARAPRRSAPTRSTTSRRRKIVCEFARCQTVSGVMGRAFAGQRPTAVPSAAAGRPLSPPRPGSAAKRRATRSSRSGG